MTRKQIWSVIRKLDYTLDDNTMVLCQDLVQIKMRSSAC